jgi:hypothetical protein
MTNERVSGLPRRCAYGRNGTDGLPKVADGPGYRHSMRRLHSRIFALIRCTVPVPTLNLTEILRMPVSILREPLQISVSGCVPASGAARWITALMVSQWEVAWGDGKLITKAFTELKRDPKIGRSTADELSEVGCDLGRNDFRLGGAATELRGAPALLAVHMRGRGRPCVRP